MPTPRHVADAIRLIQRCQPVQHAYYGAFSGGKDSTVLKHLCGAAGADVRWHFNVTTLDPPEVTRYIRQHHPDVNWDRPPQSFWSVAAKKGFPTRRNRWCCRIFKERLPPQGSTLLFGIRAAESPRRRLIWHPVTPIRDSTNTAVLPILGWSDDQVWEYLEINAIPYCKLYDQGMTRVGCIGCPGAGARGRKEHFARWPGYERLWRRLFADLWHTRTGTTQRDGRPWFGDRHFETAEDMWNWWLNDEPLPNERCEDTGLVLT